MPNAFLKDKATLKYVGTKYFGQPRQIGVPVVVNEYNKGEFQTVFVGMDNDEPGQRAAADIVAEIGPRRCRLVKLPEIPV